MDQTKFIKIAKKVMSDETPLVIEMDIRDAWMLLSGLQLLVRHPAVSQHTKDIWAHTARQIQEAIVTLHPEAQPLIEMGWNSDFDVDADGKPVRQH